MDEKCKQCLCNPSLFHPFKRNYHGRKKWITVYLDVNPFTRFSRMVKRGDSIFAALKRLRHDHRAFKHFKKRDDIVVVKNNDVQKVSDIIYTLHKAKKWDMVDWFKRVK